MVEVLDRQSESRPEISDAIRGVKQIQKDIEQFQRLPEEKRRKLQEEKKNIYGEKAKYDYNPLKINVSPGIVDALMAAKALVSRIYKDPSRRGKINVTPYDFKETEKGVYSLVLFRLDGVVYFVKDEQVVGANGLALRRGAISLEALAKRHEEFQKELKAINEAGEKLKVELREANIKAQSITVTLTAREPELEMEESFFFRDVNFAIDRSEGEPRIVRARYKRTVITEGFPQVLTKKAVEQTVAAAIERQAGE